jgi:hypothetical protein
MLKLNNVEFLVGSKNIAHKSLEPFNNSICNFLSDLSSDLKLDPLFKEYPDIVTLSFWLRKQNIEKFKTDFNSNQLRLGLGLLFHITPSNIATNFAYSLIFGLVTGNSNLVKVPSRKFEQIEIICKSINRVLKKYKVLQGMINIVRYSDQETLTPYFSSLCDGRIIWGGDNTIKEIKKYPIKPRSLDLTFADRYSFCVLNQEKLSKLNDNNIKDLAQRFYNDTYLVDQNACSSPHLVVWFGKGKKDVRKKFWECLNHLVEKKYDISDYASMDKLTKLYRDIIDYKNLKNFKNYKSNLHIINLKFLEKNNHEMTGKWGFFYEYETNNLNNLSKFINKKYQTLTYFGFNKIFLSKFVSKNKLKGLDRIVPIGQSLNMNFFWDGYDITKILTRVIDIQ